tara:strand:+ start:875 stop:1066 length:192 start_codon:yes stop_codon:yes gene_type:complete
LLALTAHRNADPAVPASVDDDAGVLEVREVDQDVRSSWSEFDRYGSAGRGRDKQDNEEKHEAV